MFIGTLISGLVDAFVSPETMTQIQPRNHLVAIALSGVLGVFFPMCECGVVPVIRRMIRKGLPVSKILNEAMLAPRLSRQLRRVPRRGQAGVHGLRAHDGY